MRNAKLIFYFCVGAFFISCNSKSERNEMAEKSVVKFTAPVITDEPIEEGEVMQSQRAEPTSNVSVDKKKIIKDGSISIQTNDIEACKKNVEALVKQLGGYIDSEYLQNNDEQISYDLKARIPANKFENMLTDLENGKDEIKSKNIQSRDVTEEYVDIESRLANKQMYLKRYKELLTKASTVRDVLAIEEQIRIIQEEIESREGRLKFLNDQITYSTLDINLFKVKEYVYKPEAQDKFSERLKDSLSNGWHAVVGFVVWIFGIWPFILFVLTLVYGIKWRRHYVKNAKK
jgi:hypothetical protein